jgi:hypothetical protein
LGIINITIKPPSFSNVELGDLVYQMNGLKQGLIIRKSSEFNVQANLYNQLINKLRPLGFEVYGEVRILEKYKTGVKGKPSKKGTGTRKQKGRLDIGVFYGSKIVCAVEVKNKKIKGWHRQERLYTSLGIDKIFLCTRADIDLTIKKVKEYCKNEIKNTSL